MNSNNTAAIDTSIDTATPAHPYLLPEEIARVEKTLATALAGVKRASEGPFHEEGWNQSPAHDLWRKATAEPRHTARVFATKVAAYFAAAWAGSAFADESRWMNEPLKAALFLLIDIMGQGGPLGLGNGTSQREGAFGRLGSGRRQAQDGAAYYAAALAAFEGLLHDAVNNADYAGSHLTIRWEDSRIGGELVACLEGHDSVTPVSLPSTANFAVLAGHCVLQSVGVDPPCPSSLVHFSKNISPDQAKAWYEKCVEAARKRSAELEANPNLHW